ncbi:MAG: hypothetical protein IJ786_02540 [Bacteroidaceae bacterium]|nr:hypothetical protein [Bacteroidaceae bacterium]
MYKTISSFIFALAIVCVASCDDGPVDETIVFNQDGRNVRLTAQVTGLDTWPTTLYIALAAFNNESEYAITSRRITEANGNLQVTLTGISEEATSIELCVLNTLRQRVATFAKIEGTALLTEVDTIPFDLGTVNLSMFEAIQTSIFNTTCIGCHGAGNGAAAGLYLTEGKSHEALVNQASKKVDGSFIVKPNDIEQSVLYQVLTTDVSKGWNYDHTGEVLDSRRQRLVMEWIRGGAKE